MRFPEWPLVLTALISAITVVVLALAGAEI